VGLSKKVVGLQEDKGTAKAKKHPQVGLLKADVLGLLVHTTEQRKNAKVVTHALMVFRGGAQPKGPYQRQLLEKGWLTSAFLRIINGNV
jgi:hypothetical protein